MTKQEFLRLLREDKQFDDKIELAKHRLPVIQFYITHMTNEVRLINNTMFVSNMVNIIYNHETDNDLIDYAWNQLKETFKS